MEADQFHSKQTQINIGKKIKKYYIINWQYISSYKLEVVFRSQAFLGISLN